MNGKGRKSDLRTNLLYLLDGVCVCVCVCVKDLDCAVEIYIMVGDKRQVCRLTKGSLGFQRERKGSKGSVLSPISALSLGSNSPTLYVMLKHNPSSKLN